MMTFLKWYSVFLMSLGGFISLYESGEEERVGLAVLVIIVKLPIIIYLILS